MNLADFWNDLQAILGGELLGVSKVLIMSFDRFLVAVESRELSQADKYYMSVFFPKVK